MVLNAIFTLSTIFQLRCFIGGGIQSTWRKPVIDHNSLTNFITWRTLRRRGIRTHNVSGDRPLSTIGSTVHMNQLQYTFISYLILSLTVFCVMYCTCCVLCLMLHVSLDCPFLIVPSVFSNAHWYSNIISILTTANNYEKYHTICSKFLFLFSDWFNTLQ